jgi:excisionase family DNA binding protein
MSTDPSDSEPLLTPAEVAAMFRVDPKTVTRWAKAGKLSSVRTLGGHRRYLASEVRALLEGRSGAEPETEPDLPPVPPRPTGASGVPGFPPQSPPPATPGSSGGLPTA